MAGASHTCISSAGLERETYIFIDCSHHLRRVSMKINSKVESLKTHEGAKAYHINPELMLRRSVMSCMLWEKEFYEDGETISDRIKELIPKVSPVKVCIIAIEARTKGNLRHVPLLIVREMARHNTHKHLVAKTLYKVIQRPDEITEFMAIYWKDGKCPLSNQVKKGLAYAFRKFDEHQFAKYDRDSKIKLRDVLFLCHSKPKDLDKDSPKYTKENRKPLGTVRENDDVRRLTEAESLYKKIVDRSLNTPDTWEVALSSGADKKETFLRLMRENKLGELAFIRNLRNMKDAGVPRDAIIIYARVLNVSKILPFQFIAAANNVTEYEDIIEDLLLKKMADHPKLEGKTALLIDVSGSMDEGLSAKSQLTRMDAACGVAMILREMIPDDSAIFTFSSEVKKIPLRHGMALKDAIINSQQHHATFLGLALNQLDDDYKRIIVITDEQTNDSAPKPGDGVKGYIVNIASNKNGVGYGSWNHVDGFSSHVIEWILEYEKLGANQL
jgi:60 kDa SS-A/Ro ribonucleoprotein